MCQLTPERPDAQVRKYPAGTIMLDKRPVCADVCVVKITHFSCSLRQRADWPTGQLAD
jgi:hypothetical protein